MFLKEALTLISGNREFRVCFDVKNGGMLRTECFPDYSEEPLETIQVAWALAEKFAKVDSEKYVNIYVVGTCYKPIAGYEEKILNKYPAESN